jgi:hypothetical protein
MTGGIREILREKEELLEGDRKQKAAKRAEKHVVYEKLVQEVSEEILENNVNLTKLRKLLGRINEIEKQKTTQTAETRVKQIARLKKRKREDFKQAAVKWTRKYLKLDRANAVTTSTSISQHSEEPTVPVPLDAD